MFLHTKANPSCRPPSPDIDDRDYDGDDDFEKDYGDGDEYEIGDNVH